MRSLSWAGALATKNIASNPAIAVVLVMAIPLSS
jgi:hypothetical protein